MQDDGNTGYRAKATVVLDQVVHSKTFRNLLLASFGIGFVGLAAYICVAAVEDHQARANSWGRSYSSARTMDKVDLDSSPQLPVIEPGDEPAPDITLHLAVTTNDPALVIAGAAKSVLRQDGKRYRVTVTVESTPN